MKFNSTFAILLGAAAVFSAAPAMAQTAQVNSNWTYQYDAAGDGSGGSAYDIRGMAMRLVDNKLVIALTAGSSLAGVQHAGVTNGTISYGDLFFNFSGKKFSEAEAAGQLFGIRFAESNDSPVALGVYSGVKTMSVTGTNSGYDSLQQYYDYGWGFNGGDTQKVNNTQGTALATQAAATNYFGATNSIQTSIASGNFLGGISALTSSQLGGMGLNFGSNSGSNTFGFSLDRSYLPSGSFLANLFMECGNDGMAFQASAAPEPTTMAGVALGMAGIAAIKRRRKQAAAAK
jgi:PEP-CTERM motif